MFKLCYEKEAVVCSTIHCVRTTGSILSTVFVSIPCARVLRWHSVRNDTATYALTSRGWENGQRHTFSPSSLVPSSPCLHRTGRAREVRRQIYCCSTAWEHIIKIKNLDLSRVSNTNRVLSAALHSQWKLKTVIWFQGSHLTLLETNRKILFHVFWNFIQTFQAYVVFLTFIFLEVTTYLKIEKTLFKGLFEITRSWGHEHQGIPQNFLGSWYEGVGGITKLLKLSFLSWKHSLVTPT